MKITEGERVKPDQTARDSAYWLGRIMRALIVGLGPGISPRLETFAHGRPTSRVDAATCKEQGPRHLRRLDPAVDSAAMVFTRRAGKR